MKFLTRFAVLSILVIGLAGLAFGQTALTQTSLSAAVAGNSNFSGGGNTSIDTSVTLASVTGVTAPLNGSIQSYLFIDRELMAVTALNTTSKVVGVVRGAEGTSAQDHAASAMVLVGANGAFQRFDPSGACTAAGTGFTPVVNVINANQWLCSSVTATWVPGFGNAVQNGQSAVTTAVASAAGLITPSGPLFHITGVAAITGFNIPVGFNATVRGGGFFCAIPDGIFTTTTANNIALASTSVVNKILCWTWDATNSKFVPTY